MFNLGTLKINGNKVVRKVKLTEVPKNSYVILDEDTGVELNLDIYYLKIIMEK